MGSYSNLYVSHSPAPPKVGELELEVIELYLISKFNLPLLWFSLFEPKDITNTQYYEEQLEQWPHLVTSRIAALQKLSSRREWLTTNFPLLNPLWIAQFESVLDKVTAPFIHLETWEVGSLNGTGADWNTDISCMLSMFETSRLIPPTTASQTFESKKCDGLALYESHFGLADSVINRPDPDGKFYCGHSGISIEPMPWELSMPT